MNRLQSDLIWLFMACCWIALICSTAALKEPLDDTSVEENLDDLQNSNLSSENDVDNEVDADNPSGPYQMPDVRVFTVASEETDGYLRMIRSARVYDIEVSTLGMGVDWEGGNMQYLGGGQKINLLREALEKHKSEKETIILFVDSYDVVFADTLETIVKRFTKSGAKILFSAEKFCWPDKSLAVEYPSVSPTASRFLNSGAFIGYAPQVYKLLEENILNSDDDQRYYTATFLNEEKRIRLNIKLDTQSSLFQSLNGAKDDVKLKVDADTNQGILENVNTLTTPCIIHGNGPSKIELNAYANYLAKTFNKICLVCQENRIDLNENDLPTIVVAVIITKPVPFFEFFLQGLQKLNYPKDRIHLFVYSNQAYHEEAMKEYLKSWDSEYLSIKTVWVNEDFNERRGRQLALQEAKRTKANYFFNLDADVHIDDSQVLRELLIANKQFVAPVISKYDELWSNFWGALTNEGYYARSHDYVDIVKGSITGMWNVPYVSGMYLVKQSAFKYMNFDHPSFDPDMALCESFRNNGIFMYITNVRHYGHFVNSDDFDHTKSRPDFYMLFSNKFDWIKKYIHPNYAKQLEANATIPQPCTDVFWFQIGTDAFCDDMIAIMEAHGGWSDGSNKDARLEGGYEAVPTRDIHMKQVGLDGLWLKFLQKFVRPLQEKVFMGYYHNPPVSLMNFVVRYRPDEQPSLRPHHDSSTYTINIALNRVGVDYEGGGCNFLRYNCSVTDTKKGWMLMHPGRLTHFHEGLLVKKGTRYIMISFINP